MTTQSSQPTVKTDVFTIVNNRILEQLDKGVVPWRQPWTSAGAPRNLITGRPYRGLNVLLLASLGYSVNLFLTLKQVNELGGKIRKGEHACPVVFWSQKDGEPDEKGEKEVKRILRYYSVFNIEQCLELPEDRIPVFESVHIDPIKECELVIEGMPLPPKIHNKGSEANYNPATDEITMPKVKSFVDSEAYYTTLFHELVHSTGHQTRLSRESIMNPEKFGSQKYSEEELVAQIGACFLASNTGCSLKHFENDVAYIAGWLKKLKDDRRFILFASSKAQRAVDYILNQPIADVKEEIGPTADVSA